MTSPKDVAHMQEIMARKQIFLPMCPSIRLRAPALPQVDILPQSVSTYQGRLSPDESARIRQELLPLGQMTMRS